MSTQKEEVLLEWIQHVDHIDIAQVIIQMAGFITAGQRNALRDKIKSDLQAKQDNEQTRLTEDVTDRTSFDFV